jgi:hypothetical protein
MGHTGTEGSRQNFCRYCHPFFSRTGFVDGANGSRGPRRTDLRGARGVLRHRSLPSMERRARTSVPRQCRCVAGPDRHVSQIRSGRHGRRFTKPEIQESPAKKKLAPVTNCRCSSVGAVYDQPVLPETTEKRAVIDRPYRIQSPIR